MQIPTKIGTVRAIEIREPKGIIALGYDVESRLLLRFWIGSLLLSNRFSKRSLLVIGGHERAVESARERSERDGFFAVFDVVDDRFAHAGDSGEVYAREPGAFAMVADAADYSYRKIA